MKLREEEISILKDIFTTIDTDYMIKISSSFSSLESMIEYLSNNKCDRKSDEEIVLNLSEVILNIKERKKTKNVFNDSADNGKVIWSKVCNNIGSKCDFLKTQGEDFEDLKQTLNYPELFLNIEFDKEENPNILREKAQYYYREYLKNKKLEDKCSEMLSKTKTGRNTTIYSKYEMATKVEKIDKSSNLNRILKKNGEKGTFCEKAFFIKPFRDQKTENERKNNESMHNLSKSFENLNFTDLKKKTNNFKFVEFSLESGCNSKSSNSHNDHSEKYLNDKFDSKRSIKKKVDLIESKKSQNYNFEAKDNCRILNDYANYTEISNDENLNIQCKPNIPKKRISNKPSRLKDHETPFQTKINNIQNEIRDQKLSNYVKKTPTIFLKTDLLSFESYQKFIQYNYKAAIIILSNAMANRWFKNNIPVIDLHYLYVKECLNFLSDYLKFNNKVYVITGKSYNIKPGLKDFCKKINVCLEDQDTILFIYKKEI
ncbi:hypothetical protein EDEG_01544 [Edhazardia aedis USNM 41457]|uniref:Smr domain-containing protein n=1 Tax=Edhazardia aedis (strain USNM 41457) TaxID=1003232 RepID=J9D9J7_EDHAE|nr:hypothetical protein EDEG_01544 [Edhazardia aedis USNM 41457]|eukprot:EJW04169.1 hypothetical protein EDEG_01544 [Edhazardia aedis USNM 41457]